MTNSSDTFKTGEIGDHSALFLCLNCMQAGKTTEVSMQKGAIFPYCEACGTKDATYRLKAALLAR